MDPKSAGKPPSLPQVQIQPPPSSPSIRSHRRPPSPPPKQSLSFFLPGSVSFTVKPTDKTKTATESSRALSVLSFFDRSKKKSKSATTMRMSCNGCRVLRKGCSENCSIRPCLQWIKSPDSQANATVFLAKFYGRAGLMNLINAGPEHLRPAIFRSLLYEACGRIVNPIYGSVGLLWSGSWPLCQAAVENVLKGAPIVQISSEAAIAHPGPLKPYDIRHVSREGAGAVCPGDLHRVKARNRFKKTLSKPRAQLGSVEALAESAPCVNFRWQGVDPEEARLSPDSHKSSGSSNHSELHNHHADGDTDSMQSNETVEASLLDRPGQYPSRSPSEEEEESGGFNLHLTLGFEPREHVIPPHQQQQQPRTHGSLSFDLPI